MYRIDVFNMDLETDTSEAKSRDKAIDYELCLFDLYKELRDLVKYQEGKTAEDAWNTFLTICNDHNIDPVA